MLFVVAAVLSFAVAVAAPTRSAWAARAFWRFFIPAGFLGSGFLEEPILVSGFSEEPILVIVWECQKRKQKTLRGVLNSDWGRVLSWTRT